MLTGTCGHDIKEGGGFYLSIKSFDENKNRTSKYGHYCKDCKEYYQDQGYALQEDEMLDWLLGRI
jgi:hypothetical protein